MEMCWIIEHFTEFWYAVLSVFIIVSLIHNNLKRFTNIVFILHFGVNLTNILFLIAWKLAYLFILEILWLFLI